MTAIYVVVRDDEILPEATLSPDAEDGDEVHEIRLAAPVGFAIEVLRSRMCKPDQEKFDRFLRACRIIVTCRNCGCKNPNDLRNCVDCQKPLFAKEVSV